MGLTGLLISAGTLCVCAREIKDNSPVIPAELTIEENIAYPSAPAKASSALIRHMDRIASVFEKHGLTVKRYRKGEVIDIVVPAEMLFAPNEMVLSPNASKILVAFRKILELPSMYRMLVVVHTDNTGSEEYADAITEARANAIDEYLEKQNGGKEINLIPYGVGNDEPLAPDNNSIVNRNRNRRVEFYIIPEQQTIDQARTGKL